MIYGYARISTKTQKIERQLKNLQDYHKDIILHQEAYTGATHARPEWTKLQTPKEAKRRSPPVSDSVSRMSRDAKEGTKKYFHLREKGINLVFLKERHIDTEAYERALEQVVNIDSGLRCGCSLRPRERHPSIFGTKATDDIKKAFEQSQKEVDDLSQRTKEGLREAKTRGSQVGRKV